ncbi:hypothetical protein I317_07746 [Kwoniella heveanensis CBS 569]|nr:hypothetical protein I317_07746 [Kwoniella heveanensis CBS 569]
MAFAQRLRFLRLHTLPGQIVFLSTFSILGGLAITSLRDPEDDERRKAKRRSSSTSTNSKGDIVDAVQRATGGGVGGGSSSSSGGPTLADALTAERGASLWWNYARDSPSVTGRLVSRDKETTILVPTDKAIMALGRKPHQHPGLSYKGAFTSSKTNTERFLAAHMIEGGKLSEDKLSTLLDGFDVEMNKDKTAKGGWKVQPGDIEVMGIKETSNGRIVYLNKVLPY